MKRDVAMSREETAVSGPSTPAVPASNRSAHSAFAHRLSGPRSRADAEAAYVRARDEWIEAMRAANSGRAADMASLAIVQEAYELAAVERERWISNGHVAIPVEPVEPKRSIEVVIGQGLEWGKVHRQEPRKGIGARLKRLVGR